ncbi:hypothetical protein TWF281_001501 [Arthrobotrys megalospora]
MSTPSRLYQILEGASKQIYPDDVVVCLVPISKSATEVMIYGNYPQFQFPVPADADDPDGPTIDITAMLLTLNLPPKVPGLGYTFGRSSKADVRILIDDIKDFHFRIFFDSTIGILKFSDEARPGGVYFRNFDTNTSGRNIENLPLDSQFQIGAREERLRWGGFIPGSEAHQQRRREYLASIHTHFQSIAHTLSPPNGCRTVKGYQNWGHIRKSQFQLYKLKTKTLLAGKFRWNLGNHYCWDDTPPPPPDSCLQQEYEILRTLKHEHIVRAEEIFSTRNLHSVTGEIMSVLVTEFCMHGDLSKQNPRTWPERKHLECMKQISEGLSYIHSLNIIHNAIVYENILVSKVEPLHIKLSGFSESRMDARVFDSWIEDTLGYYTADKRVKHFRLDDQMGVVIDQGRGGRGDAGSVTNEMIMRAQRAFPKQKGKRDNIYDAPEIADVHVTTAVDIWSLGLVHLRYYEDVEAIHRRTQFELKPLYTQLSAIYGGRVPGAFNLMNILPSNRPSALAARDEFIALMDGLKSESTGGGGSIESPVPEITLESSIQDAVSPAPYSQSGSDPYGVLSPTPPPPRPYNPEEWEESMSDDELKFRFNSPIPRRRGSPAASLLSQVASIMPQTKGQLRAREAASQSDRETQKKESEPPLGNEFLGASRAGSLEPSDRPFNPNTEAEASQLTDNYIGESTLEDSQLKRPFPEDSDESLKASKIQRPNSGEVKP